VRVHKEGAALTADGEIADHTGAPVAHRSIRKETRECSAIVRAVGVWAALVLDEEVARAATPEPAPPPPAPASTPTPPAEPDATAWPAPAAQEKPSPEAALFLKNPADHRVVEIGAAASYMYGALGDDGAAIGGVHVFAVAEIDGGWFLRPELGYGRSLKDVGAAPTDLSASWGMARFDVCRRMPGNYLEHRGLQMDLCGGMEGGFVAFHEIGGPGSFPLLAPGAALAMRGDLASDLSAEVRGLVGVNLLRDEHVIAKDVSVQPLLVYARMELGLSWRFR
jgi:hypothetical protein